MKSNTIRNSNSKSRKHRAVSFIKSVVFTVVGLIILLPFFWIVIVSGHNFHHITFPIFMMLMGFLVGAPMFMYGIVSFFVSNGYNRNYSSTDLDISRIRYVVETDRTNRK